MTGFSLGNSGGQTMSQEQISKVWEMIKDIKFAMLTSDDDGMLRSRPMVASQKAFEGTLWFFTREHAHKVDEVRHDPRVNVSYADGHAQNYVSLSGTASLVRDKATLKAHWSEALRTWFPKGLDDPEVALLKVDVEQAEYWDTPNSKMVYAYGYVKARLTGTAPHPGENAKVTL
jgi:prepilin-type processing-associated H-X9-DG protein